MGGGITGGVMSGHGGGGGNIGRVGGGGLVSGSQW